MIVIKMTTIARTRLNFFGFGSSANCLCHLFDCINNFRTAAVPGENQPDQIWLSEYYLLEGKPGIPDGI
jgi:hypothetical protein